MCHINYYLPMLLKDEQYSRSIILLWGLIDVCSIFIACGITNFDNAKNGSILLINSEPLSAIIILCWLSSFLLTKAYSIIYFKRIKYIFFGLGKCFLIHVLLLLSSLVFITQLNTGDLKFIVAVHFIFLSTSIFLRLLQLLLYRKVMSLKRFQTRYIIIGNTFGGRRLYRYLEKAKLPGFVFLGFFDDYIKTPLTVGITPDIPSFCKEHQVNQIFYALSSDSILYHQIARFADDNYIHFGKMETDKLLSKSTIRTYPYDEYISALPFQRAKLT